MHTGIYEFEIVPSEGGYVAIPYDLEGATQADSFDDLCLSVADWLKVTIESYELRGARLPHASFGNVPRYGGTNMVFSVTAGRETIERVTVTEASRLLRVTPGRVSQMVASCQLEGWREGRNAYVTLDSVRARLAERPRAGRPRKVASA